MTILDKLSLGIRAHHADDLAAAEAAYRDVLSSEPDNPDALHLLGVVLHQRKRSAEAVDLMQRAVSVSPTSANFHANLGHALRADGKLDESLASFQRALQLDRDHADAHNGLGSALRAHGRLSEAAASFRRALRLKPNHVEAHNNLGNVLKEQGRLDEAKSSYREALRLRPELADAHNNLATIHKEQGELDKAVTAGKIAIQLNPEFAEAHTNLGCVLNELERYDEAAASHRRALQLKPDYADAHNNLGVALADMGKREDAVRSYQCALTLKPDFVEAHYNLGIALMTQGQHDRAAASYQLALQLKPDHIEARNNLALSLVECGAHDRALACYKRALEDQPEHAETHYNSSLLHLLLGDFERGWRGYEWRARTENPTCSNFDQPRWFGSRLPDQTVLIHAEQGLGDTLQFIRYAPLVKQRVGQVVMRCHGPLRQLLQNVGGIDTLITDSESLPPFDCHVPLLSLPGVFQAITKSIAGAVPYIFPDETLVQHWQARLDEIIGFRVGISWQGNPEFKLDRFRSVPLGLFSRLAELAEVRLISLQKRHGVEQLEQLRHQFEVIELGADLDETAGPFMDTAAAMRNLDLFVTSDTALAHLAGALGIRVWMALPLVPDWRWQLERADSPWYPTMRLFRQRKRGDWDEVFRDIRQALQKLIARPVDSR